jgi:WD40 repeat protein
LIAFPSADRKAGFFTMVNMSKDRPRIIEAHNHDIECLEMDPSGSHIASASKKGTIIRVFRVKDGTVLQEFRRGIDNAKIMSICFDMTGQMLAVSSDSGTVHVYMIPCEESDRDSVSTSGGAAAADLRNKKSRFSFFKKAIKYFDSEWSSLQLKVDEKIVFVNFNAESSSILVYKSTGKFWRHELVIKDESKPKRKFELTEPIRLLKQS